jgi:hypothetical protein
MPTEMNAKEKQFSLARVASKTGGAVKAKFYQSARQPAEFLGMGTLA